jgi:SAM-dependent methyltransferase
MDHALKNVYQPIYRKVIQAILSERPVRHRVRILEYGCGGGMNLLELVELFHAVGLRVENAIGTDFSPGMIEAARNEAERRLSGGLNAVVRYVIARHETLVSDLASNKGTQPRDLYSSFDFVLGVNTFRFTHRQKQENAFARELFALLRPGGYSVMIDMHRGVRFRGSRLHDRCTQSQLGSYLPTCREYSRAFQRVGFVITDARPFFCCTSLPVCTWLPDVMKLSLLASCRVLRPLLDACLPPFAKHLVVIAKKPIPTERNR